jgi:class 3 adenylate cyclase
MSGTTSVSETARAEAGSTYRFTDRGETSLRGVPGRWHLYAVRRWPAENDRLG